MAKKSWNEKLQTSKDLPKFEFIGYDSDMAKRFGSGKMLVAAPVEYDEVMKRVPPGKLITTVQIRELLAKKHEAEFTCQLTAGIFVNIAANASHERQIADQGNLTPYWRTIKKGGELCEKYPDGIDGHKHLLEMEGFEVFKKGKRYFVKDYENYLVDISEI